jgi:hypothetical protein
MHRRDAAAQNRLLRLTVSALRPAQGEDVNLDVRFALPPVTRTAAEKVPAHSALHHQGDDLAAPDAKRGQPRFLFKSFIAYSKVTNTRAPVGPRGRVATPWSDHLVI